MKAMQLPDATEALRARERAENSALVSSKEDGRSRLRLNQPHAVLLRQSDERNALLRRLTDAMSAGRRKKATLTEVLEAGLDALEEKLRGK